MKAVTIVCAAGLAGAVVGGGVLAVADEQPPTSSSAPRSSTTLTTLPQVEPWWTTNAAGMTIGVQKVGGPAADLFPALGDDGTKGYIRSADTDWEPAKTLEEAAQIMRDHPVDKNGNVVVNLYAIDGKTVIGRSTIAHVSMGN